MFSVPGQPVFLLGPQELNSIIPENITNAAMRFFFMITCMYLVFNANIMQHYEKKTLCYYL